MNIIIYYILNDAYTAQIPVDYAQVEKSFGKQMVQDLQEFNSFEDFCQQYYLMSGTRLCLDFEYPEVEYQDNLGWRVTSTERRKFSFATGPQ